MKLVGSAKSKINKDKHGENVPHLQITEVVLIHCNSFSNDYQQDSRVLYPFVPNKSFGQLLDISLENFIFSKTFNSEFSYNWIMVYWSKFWTSRDRRQNKHYLSYCLNCKI